MIPYRLIAQMMSEGSLECLGPDRSTERLSLEIKTIKRKMAVLPTARESEALPEIVMLRDFSRLLLTEQTKALREEWQSNEQIEKFFIEELLEPVCSEIIKARIYTNKEIIRTADALFINLVAFATMQLPRQKPYYNAMINTIIDKSADYYKTNGKENSLYNFPFGEPIEVDEEIKKWIDNLQPGTKVDCLKNYANKKNWSRAVIESKDSVIVRVRYLHDLQDSYIQNRYFEIAPLGTRETDFEWRENLKVGDLVDYYHFRYDWGLYKIIDVFEEENIHHELVKTVELQRVSANKPSDQQPTEAGTTVYGPSLPSGYQYNQSQAPNTNSANNYQPSFGVSQYSSEFHRQYNVANYEGMLNQTVTVKAHSPSLAKPEKFSSRAGIQIDDSDDAVFLASEKKKKMAILRLGTTSGASSIYLVKYLNTFGEHGGFDFIMDVLNHKITVNQEVMGQIVRMVQNASENLVEPFIKANGEKILNSIMTYVTENAEKNLRNLTQQNLINVIESVSSLAQRAYSIKKAKSVSQLLMMKLGILCLKSDILEKQFFGAKQLMAIESKTREFDSEISKSYLAECLSKENIFEKIVKGHPGLVAKGAGVLKILISEDRISESQLSMLWDQICKTDSDTRASLHALVKDISWEFSRDQIQFLVRKMLESADEVNPETFELLCLFKKIGWTRHNDSEVLNLVNDVFWEILQSEKEMKKELNKEVMQNFVKSLDNESAQSFIIRIVDNYLHNKNKLRNLKLLRSMMKHSDDLCAQVMEVIKQKNIVDQCAREIVTILRAKMKPETSSNNVKQNNFIRENSCQTDSLSPEDKFQVELRLKLIRGIMKYNDSEEVIVTFAHFEQIWDVVFAMSNSEEFIHNWIKDYILSDEVLSSVPELKQFFMRNYRKLLGQNKSDFFKFFMLIFFRVNVIEEAITRRKKKFETMGFIQTKSTVKNINILSKPSEELFGAKELWELFVDSSTYELCSQIANLLTKIYLPPEFFENENREIYTEERRKLIDKSLAMIAENDVMSTIKACLILHRMIKIEERKISSPLVSLASLKEGEKLVVNIEKDTKYIKEKTKINVFSNQTIAEFKELVSKEYRMTPDLFTLVRENGEEIPSTENILTLETAGIKMRDLILVREIDVPEITEVPLLNEEGSDFSEHSYKVFHEIFTEYSHDEKMTREFMAKFTSNATDNTYCGVSDERIISVFQKYDPQNRGYISEKDFVDFYRIAACANENRQRTVRQNLQSLGYGKDLKLKRTGKDSGPLYKSLLRYELCLNENFAAQIEKYIETYRVDQSNVKSADRSPMLSPLVNYKIAENFYNFIELLPPNVGNIKKILEDPVSVASSVSHPVVWKINQIVLNALIFKRAESEKILKVFDIDYTENQHKELLVKVVQPKFVQGTLHSIGAIQKNSDLHSDNLDIAVSGMRILEKIFKAALNLVDAEMVSDLKNFISFFIKQKKKVTEKTQTEPPTKKEEENDKFPSIIKDKNKDKEKEDEGQIEEEQIKEVGAALSGSGLLDSLVKNLDYPSLNNFIVDLLKQLNAIKGEPSKALKTVLKSAMIVLIASLKLYDQELPLLLKNEGFQQLMFSGLAHEKGIVRLFYKNFYAFLTTNSKDIRIKIDFLKILIGNITNQNNEDFHSLIELACNILGDIGEMKAQNKSQDEILHNEFNFSELFANFSDKALTHVSTEVSFDEKEDNLLIGYLAFMEKILRADELVLSHLDADRKKRLVTYLFKECLFELTASGFVFKNIKCKSKKSRSAAMNLLVQLLQKDLKNTINLIITGLLPLSKHLPDLTPQPFGLMNEWNRKNNLGFLGIKNLGCVCYMIAMLQQFYCTPAFRHGILMAADNKPQNIVDVKGTKIDDNLFHQIQKMFSYLDYSERRDFNPLEFCYSYKDFTGQPVNVMVQQDADEFLKVIFDKLEDAVKKSPYIGVLNSVFAGKICNVIVCKGCGFEKVNEEAFNNLSLEVKGLTNLPESFEKFIEEEIISDYMCDKCKNKCDISKKAMLKSLPNVLIVYLKKMVFDVDLLMNIKIHSKYEFPMEINLKKYMHFDKPGENKANREDADELIITGDQERHERVEAQNEGKTGTANQQPEGTPINNDDDEYEYKLVGVVIHKGNAEYGHYTSLINVNRNDPRRENIDQDLWLEFDDSRVAKFDMSHFQEECFGNQEEKDFTAHLMSAENHVSKSAYILVYDKVKKSPIVFPFNEETLSEKEKIIANLRDPSAVEIGPDFLKTHFYNLKSTLPEVYSKEIEKDNSALVLEQQLLSSSFTNSLADIFSNIDLTITPDIAKANDEGLILRKTYAEAVLKTLPNFLFKIYCVSNDNYRIGKIVRAMESALAFLNFIKIIATDRNKDLVTSIEHTVFNFYNEHVLENMRPIVSALLNSSDQYIRNGLTEFVIGVFGMVVKTFNIQMLEPSANTENTDDLPFKTIVHNSLTRTLTILVGFIPNQDINPTQFRKFGQVFVVLHKLAEQNLCVRQFLLTNSVLNMIFDLYMMLDCSKTTQFEKALSPLLSLFADLMIQLRAAAQNVTEETHAQLHAYFNYFVRIELFTKILKEDYLFNNYEALKSLVSLMAFENQVISDQIAYFSLKAIASANDVDVIGSLEAIRGLLSINDSLIAHRVKTIFGIPKLSEQSVVLSSNEKSFIYGLRKESSLKKSVYNYIITFGMDRGLLEILSTSKDINENISLLLIYYVVEYADIYPAVLDYLVQLPPINYLSATYYDWFKGYVEHSLKYMNTTYSAYRSDIALLYFNSLPDKLEAFEKKLRDYIESKKMQIGPNQKLFVATQASYSNYVNAQQNNDSQDLSEIFAFRPHYIIGKTNRVQNLGEYKIDEDEYGFLKIKFHLVNVSLMESSPTGTGNNSLPATAINYDNYINKSVINNHVLIRFFGGKEDVLYDEKEGHEETELVSILSDEENRIDPSKKQKTIHQHIHSNQNTFQNVKADEESLYVNRDYILRISLSNKTNEEYIVQVKITGSESANFEHQQMFVSVRPRKSNFAIQNLTLKDINGSFAGLKVLVSAKKLENANMKHIGNTEYTEFIEVFDFDSSR